MLRITNKFYNNLSGFIRWHLVLLIRLSTLTVLLSGNSALAIGADYKLKAAYIYQFTKFTHWPENVFEKADSPIRICVMGKNPFGNSLAGFASRKSQNRYLLVEYIVSLKGISHCQLVYISQSEEKKLTEIIHQINRLPILSVSDMAGFARRGGIIGFIPKKRRVGIEINIAASRKAELMLSSKLLEVSTIVESDDMEVSP